MQDKKYKDFGAGRAGNGSINLATGALTFVHEDTGSDASALSISISHVYSSKAAGSNTDITYGKGFKLNLQQTLKKYSPSDSNNTKYTYTDAGGIEHSFEDRYYYIADIDGTGAHRTYYEYDDVICKVKTVTAPNGSKLSYAHDTNTDEVTAITQSTEEGEGNTTNCVYTAGYLTELTGGGNTVRFDYDQKGRKTAVYLNGTAPYAVYGYQEGAGTTNQAATVTTAPNSASGYTVKTEWNKDGDLLRVKEGNPLSLADSVKDGLQYTYDVCRTKPKMLLR